MCHKVITDHCLSIDDGYDSANRKIEQQQTNGGRIGVVPLLQ